MTKLGGADVRSGEDSELTISKTNPTYGTIGLAKQKAMGVNYMDYASANLESRVTDHGEGEYRDLKLRKDEGNEYAEGVVDKMRQRDRVESGEGEYGELELINR